MSSLQTNQSLKHDFQFFPNYKKVITCPTSVSICKPKSGQFYFKAMFRVWCLQFTNLNEDGPLNLSPDLQGSRSGLYPITCAIIFI